MEIYLVRHTTPKIEKGICYGQSDINVTHTFEQEAQKILDKLPSKRPIISSPLKRCQLLAAKIGDYTTDKRLLEMNFGDWELQAWNDIPKATLDAWMNEFVHTATPNGESYIDLYNRVWEFINSIEKPSIVVTHSGVIRSVITKLSGIDLKDSFNEQLDYGVVVRVNLTTKTYVIL